MNRPQRFLIRMAVFLAVVVLVVVLLAQPLAEAFMANPLFNGLILGVVLLGVLYIFRQVILLNPEVAWLQRVRAESSGGRLYPAVLSEQQAPRLLGPLATMIGERRGRLTLSALSMRSLLDGIQARIAESHEISRYLIGLLIFLGLLGTFWGLLDTVRSVAEAIGELSGDTTDPASLFAQLRDSLVRPLDGMGTAFSSSLFGLAGSLVLGFLELQAGQAHNRFMNELEEWLSGITRLSSGAGPVDGGGESVPAFIQALLEQTADSLESLQRSIAAGEEGRHDVNRNLLALTERLGTLTDQMRTEQSVLLRLAESQQQLKPILTRLAEGDGGFQGGMDEATRDHIRSLDIHVARMAEEAASGRENTVREIRSEIRLLARTIAAIAEESDPDRQY